MATWDVTAKCIAYWKLDDNAGNTVVDDCVGAFDGVAPVNTDTLSVAGKLGTALKGSPSGTVNLGQPILNLSTFALEFWIKTGIQDIYQTFISNSDNAVGFQIQFGADGDNPYVRCDSSGGVNQCGADILGIGDNTYHHIVYNFYTSGATGYVDCYRDKVLSGQYTYVLGGGIGNALDLGILNWQEIVCAIDNLRIYNDILTQDEIEGLFNKRAGTIALSGTVPVWDDSKLYLRASADKVGSGANDLYLRAQTDKGSQTQNITPTTQGLTLTLNTPAVEAIIIVSVEVTPATQSLTITQNAPTIENKVTDSVAPATQTLSLSQNAPAVACQISIAVAPAVQELTLTQNAPAVAGIEVLSVEVQPASLSLTLTQIAPAIEAKISDAFSATVLSLALTQTAPAVAVQVSIAIAPATLSLTLTQPAPAVVSQEISSFSASVLSLTLTQNAPVVAPIQIAEVTPATLSLTLTQYEPVIDTGLTVDITPEVLTLSLTQIAPAVANQISIGVAPSVLTLSLTQIAPTVTGQASIEITPTVQALSLTQITPEVIAQVFEYAEFFAIVMPLILEQIAPAYVGLVSPKLSLTGSEVIDSVLGLEVAGISVSGAESLDRITAGTEELIITGAEANGVVITAQERDK
jgi:hypothetical protein